MTYKSSPYQQLPTCHPSCDQHATASRSWGDGGQDGALIRACGVVHDHFGAHGKQSKREEQTKSTVTHGNSMEMYWTRAQRTKKHIVHRFIPHEVDDCPVNPAMSFDEEATERFLRDHSDDVIDNWRFRGNSLKHGSKKNKWLGSTTFRLLDEPDPVTNTCDYDVHLTSDIAICTHDNTFVAQEAQLLANETPIGRRPVLHLILQKRNGGSKRYQFELHAQDVVSGESDMTSG